MIAPLPGRRGQPLLALGGLLLGWAAVRAVLWEDVVLPITPVLARPGYLPVTAQGPVPVGPARAVHRDRAIAAPARTPLQAAPLPTPPRPVALPLVPTALILPPKPATLSGPGLGTDRAGIAAGHQIAWLAGVAQLPLPAFVTGARPRLAARPSPLPQPQSGRWSFDGWLLLRDGAGARPLPLGGLPGPTYGASQIGGVLRFQLAPPSAHRPALFLRAASALHRPRGEELALGLAVRPIARVPMAVQAELRLTADPRGDAARPAMLVVTELPSVSLPFGLAAEAYAQAGYVSGAAGTAFADGLARIDAPVARLGRGEMRAGAGLWGGLQRGAGRLDFGPTAMLDLPVGNGRIRVSADWRLRAAGNAAPAAGPALTLSAGF